MPRIRLKIHVTGTFHGIEGGVPPGTIVDVSDFDADRYIRNHIAEYVDDGKENAVLEPEVETATVKRGRPKKQPEWHDDDAPGFKEVETP